jgi:hypothetical protein
MTDWYECPDCDSMFITANARDGHLAVCSERESVSSTPTGVWYPDTHGRWGTDP